MDSRKYVLKETLRVAIGEAVCVAAMIGVFALLGYFSREVVLGGIIGGLVAVGNFFFMALSANAAGDKAEKQDVKGGQATIKSSFMLRMVIIFVLLLVFAKSGVADVIAMVIPLALVRPIIMVTEFFSKPGKEEP